MNATINGYLDIHENVLTADKSVESKGFSVPNWAGIVFLGLVVFFFFHSLNLVFCQVWPGMKLQCTSTVKCLKYR